MNDCNGNDHGIHVSRILLMLTNGASVPTRALERPDFCPTWLLRAAVGFRKAQLLNAIFRFWVFFINLRPGTSLTQTIED